MPYHEFFWTERARQKLLDNGLSVDEVEFAVLNARKRTISESSGRPAYIGETPSGAVLFVAFEVIDAVTISVVTAFTIREF